MWRVGVIGCGYWGPNLIRNFVMNDSTEVRIVADIRPERLRVVNKVFPAIRTTTSPEELLAEDGLDLVAIATPPRTHYALVKAALERGRHVLVEKPMVTSSQEAEELVGLAERKGLVIFVDHTFLFTGAVRKLKEMIDEGELGEIRYYDSRRLNLGIHQGDVSVVWDIGVHDVSILQHLLGRDPDVVSCVGACYVGENTKLYDMAHLSLRYGKTLAHATLSWLAPVKVRQIIIGGSRKMAIYDDLENVAKLQVFDCGARAVSSGHLDELRRALVEYRRGDMCAPKLDDSEALKVETDYIVRCLETGERQPINGGRHSIGIIRALEAAERSCESLGAFVPLAT